MIDVVPYEKKFSPFLIALIMEAVALFLMLICSLVVKNTDAFYGFILRIVIMSVIGFFGLRRKEWAMWLFCFLEGATVFCGLVVIILLYPDKQLNLIRVAGVLIASCYFLVAAILASPPKNDFKN